MTDLTSCNFQTCFECDQFKPRKTHTQTHTIRNNSLELQPIYINEYVNNVKT